MNLFIFLLPSLRVTPVFTIILYCASNNLYQEKAVEYLLYMQFNTVLNLSFSLIFWHNCLLFARENNNNKKIKNHIICALKN